MLKSGQFNPIELFKAGGWVMYPILALAVAMFTVLFERLIVIIIQKLKLSPEKYLITFQQSLQKHNGDKMKAADEIQAVAKKRGGVCGDILTAVIDKYRDGAQKKMAPAELKEWMRQSMEERANVEVPQLEAHLGWLAVISNCATLMGLFGTVFGMIESFTSMANSPGGVKADEMAGGIAIALTATLFGLTVAIPSLLLYNWMKNFLESFVLQIEEAIVSILDTLAS